MQDLGPCVLWEGCVGVSGYGRKWRGGRDDYAHRAAYEEARGPIPPGLTIDHLCRVKLCVNPDHLEVVTSRENIRRAAVQDGKRVCPHGENTERAIRSHRKGPGNCKRCKTEYNQEFRRRRRLVDPEYRIKMNQKSREYRRRRYQEDPEYRNRLLKKKREGYRLRRA